jgi:hypothetical protein
MVAMQQLKLESLTHRLALGDRQAEWGGEQRVEGQEDKVQQHYPRPWRLSTYFLTRTGVT